MAVAVVVHEGAAVAPGLAGATDACLFAYVRESAVAVVVIEDVFSVVRDVEIFIAVIVVIADANALAPSGVSQACFLSDVSESSVMIIMIEMACVSFSGRRRVKAGAIDDENVGPAVVVVVENGDPGSRGFNDVFFCVHAAENHRIGETCFFGDIGEMCERSGIVFWELRGAEEKRRRQKKSKRNPR